MPFSIMHISDLHRTPGDPISNAELISALVGDRDRYTQESPQIGAPQAIVVSGDIVQGVALGLPDHEAVLNAQYEVAETFLGELANRFLDGDRSRVILVPGNHDVNWNVARQAMKKVSSADIPKNLSDELHSEEGTYRWDWKSQTLYQIVDQDMYRLRLGAYRKFFGRFYSRIPGLLKVDSENEANLFSLCGGRIGIAAFNSCHGNDCYAYHGMIRRDVIARSHLDLVDLGNIFDLQIAVWHHSIEGPPYKSDYMDVDIVRGMIGRGFRIGLYGHQHKIQITPHQIWLPDRERMAVISAGSLCAGAKELPTGHYRQYNILEIADDFTSAKVHVRAMSVSNLFVRGLLPDFGNNSFAELDWNRPKNAVGQEIDTRKQRVRLAVEKAEEALKRGRPSEAIQYLSGLELPPASYQRSLMIASAAESEKWELLVATVGLPDSIDEFVAGVNALIHLKDYGRAIDFIGASAERLGVSETDISDLLRRVATEQAIHP